MRIFQAAAILVFISMTAFSQELSGTIRLWGDSDLQNVVLAWQPGFHSRYPRVTFETKLLGTGTGMAGLYTGVADIAFMGRLATPKEVMAFEWVYKYKPLAIAILTGSLGTPGKSAAITIFVHRDNPAARLSFDQLEAIFGCDPDRVSRPARAWGDLGLTGAWAARPIHIYMPDAESGTASFFRQAVLGDSRKWNWQNLQEIQDENGRGIINALASDANGIAFSYSSAASAGVKPIALATRRDGLYVDVTAQNLISGKYPLTRLVYAYVIRQPGHPLDPTVKAFLRYILDREGQETATHQTGFLPLNATTVREQAKRLE